MFGLGIWELLVILGIVVILFGAKPVSYTHLTLPTT